jgi:UDP-4-amino-4,6-dideoxy-N-acetyl-beta-L-altrosamine transaminase
MIPYGRQDISDADIAAVVEILQSEFLTQGPTVPKFEMAVATYSAAKHAVAVNSATSALHIACLALGLGPGDIFWTTPITFVASANCGLYCGATVDFVDIDPRTFNMCVDSLRIKLELAQKNGCLPKVVIPVHLCGLSCDMKAIGELSKKYGFSVIEDASHAIGGRYQDSPIGSCMYSDITVFSFHPVKIITTGEGGMAVTNNGELAEQMSLLRSHGITRDPARMTHEPDGDWYYQQIALGYNYRMTDIQAALGLSQMARVDEFVARRHALVRQYNDTLNNLPVNAQYHPPDCYSGAHLYVIRLASGELAKSHKQIFGELREAGIGANLHYIPVYAQPWYQSMGFKPGDYPQAEQYYAQALSLPLYPGLRDDEQRTVVDALRRILK